MPTMLAVAKSKKEEIYRQSEKLFFRIARPGDTRLQFQDRVEKALIRSKNPQSVLLMVLRVRQLLVGIPAGVATARQ